MHHPYYMMGPHMSHNYMQMPQFPPYYMNHYGHPSTAGQQVSQPAPGHPSWYAEEGSHKSHDEKINQVVRQARHHNTENPELAESVRSTRHD